MKRETTPQKINCQLSTRVLVTQEIIFYQGKSVFGGIAIGKVCVYHKEEQQVKRTRVDDVDGEIARFHQAKDVAADQLGKLYDKAVKEVGEASAAIFEVHQMMLEDLDYVESIENIISRPFSLPWTMSICGDVRRM